MASSSSSADRTSSCICPVSLKQEPQMGRLRLNSFPLRCVLQTHLLPPPPHDPLSSASQPILRSCTSNVDSSLRPSPINSQEFQDLHPLVTTPVSRHLILRSVLSVALDSTVSQPARTGQGLLTAGAGSCGRFVFGVRVRGSGQVLQLGRGFSSTAVQEVEATCWSCEESSSATPFFVCSSCRAIQPLDQNLDYFQLLSVVGTFELDSKILEQKYKQLQKVLHPDLSSGKSEREQGYSADQSAQVIRAYYTLLEPLSRAQYLLKLNGYNVDEEGTIHDPALLMEIMELREEVEEATDPEKLLQIKEHSKKKMRDCEIALKDTFNGGNYASAVPIVQRMTYHHKIIEEITRKQ